MKVITIIILCVSSLTCCSQVAKDTIASGGWLQFENYDNENLFIPSDFAIIAKESSMQNSFPYLKKILIGKNIRKKVAFDYLESFLRNKQKRQNGILIQDSLLHFLYSQKIFHSGATIDGYRTIQEEIEYLKQNYTLWYLGTLELSENYKSYLIFMEDTDTSGFFFDRNIFIVNISDNQLCSITKIAYYIILAGEGVFFHSRLRKNEIFFSHITHYATMEYAKRSDRRKYKDKDEVYSKFIFDDQGYVKILWDRVILF